MSVSMNDLVEKLAAEHSLSEEEYAWLIDGRTGETASALAEEARKVRESVYGKDVYVRGLIEISNICKNDCLYCGIRRSNKNCSRYRLTAEEIFECAAEGHRLGFRTFVLQGGEDAYYTDDLLFDLIRSLKTSFPDSAVTLSLGERGRESFRKLYAAGADRYLLRHETADPSHYRYLHPSEMSFENRLQCLRDLKEIGFQTGCGFMVGSPGQTTRALAKDLKWIEEFRPEMCGIGPFVPHRDTPFGKEPTGSVELTIFLLSVIRLIHPNVLLPATTALGTVQRDGREQGMLAGANVVMPNLTPRSVRGKYELYNNKLSSGEEAAEGLKELSERMDAIGYRLAMVRGDAAHSQEL